MTFNKIESAKEKAGIYAGFYEAESPVFTSEKHGIIEQWKIEQFYGFKASGSFSLLEVK